MVMHDLYFSYVRMRSVHPDVYKILYVCASIQNDLFSYFGEPTCGTQQLATRMAVTLGHVEPFNVQTDDWSLYTERLSQYFVANDITEDKKKVGILLTVIGSKAYELIHSLLAPVSPAEKKYDELVAVLMGHLKPKPLVIAERFKFHHRNQRDGENVEQYMAELRRLSEHCDFKDYLSEALRDRLVCGLRSEAIQRRLLSQKDLTLETAYDIALSEETASRRASELQASVKTSTSSEGDVRKVAPGKPHNGKGTAQSCYRCGKSGHTPDHCFYKHQKCRVCQKKGHIAKVCRNADRGAPHGTSSPGGSPKNTKSFRNKKSGRADYVDTETEESQDIQSEDNDAELFTLSALRDPPIVLKPTVNGVELKMELDTGATVSLASERTWKEVFNSCPLEECQTILRTYTGQKLPVLGQMNVTVEYEDQKAELPLLIVPGDGPALWGRSWLSAIKLNWPSIKSITYGVESLIAKYPDLFKEELGTLKGVEIKLSIAKDAILQFKKPRPVPYALRGAVE